MATGGGVHGLVLNLGKAGSNDLKHLKCQPCLEDGHLHNAVGMCVDCDDYLCTKCYQGHTLPKPCRNHKLVDLQKMSRIKIKASIKDLYAEKCQLHDDEITQYYCIKHNRLGCTACVTLNHKLCEDVQYIPDVAKDLVNNEEYVEAEKRLKSALARFEKVLKNVSHNFTELELSFYEAIDSIKEFTLMIHDVFEIFKAEMIRTVEEMKSREMKQMTAIKNKYKSAQEELQAAWTKIQALINAQQKCGAYINMMKTRDQLAALESLTEQATMDASYTKRLITFLPNESIQEMLMHQHALGMVTTSMSNAGQYMTAKFAPGRLIKGNLLYKPDMHVRKQRESKGGLSKKRSTGTYTSACFISGLCILPDDKLVFTDNHNDTIKAMDVQSEKVLSHLKLSSGPWDVTAINSNKVAATLPDEKKVAIIIVDDNAMSLARTIDVSEECHAVDYRDDKLVVAFIHSQMIQIINMRGYVLKTLPAKTLLQHIYINIFEKLLYPYKKHNKN